MKDIRYLIAAIAVLILIVLLLPKSCNEPQLIDNSIQLQQIDSLVSANDSIKALNDSLQLNYSERKNIKDSLVIRIKTRYIPIYDTLTNEVIECLPKINVDSLIYTYENIILDADTIIKVQSIQINNLEQQNNIKDTLIQNYQTNEKVLIKSVKKERRNKWLFGASGFGLGFLTGKL
ncbi:MAG TPA: hypothetical protein PK649_12195 [Vicingus sp.]|nr:hypothetical protein [Vicingus sp.]HRP61010.1 hypothetical protein [Vicingus sp.]